MTKKETILNNEAKAYYSGFGGVEIHHVEYGIDDHVYFTAGAWCGNKKTYHRAKLYYHTDGAYFKFNGYKIDLNECININI